jgi:hypothetical protein
MRWLVLLVAVAGCRPTPPNGTVACNKSGGQECPKGYACEPASSTCWKTGEAPDLAGGFVPPDLLMATDGGSEDLMPEADMTPVIAKGEGCSTTGGAACAAGLQCVDGVCCDSACTGQCQACNLDGKKGTCSNLASGQPVGGRTACAGAGTACQGACGSGAACTYPGTTVICGASCDGLCDGAGACSSTAGGKCPNGFACGSTGCKTTCAVPADCQTNFTCNAPNCVRVPESDCLDGVDNNGDGLADCQDPTCTPVVQCVPAVTVGNEIGIFQAASCPASGYTVSSQQHQTLNAGACTGCGCKVDMTCRMTLTGYSATGCGGSVNASMTLDATTGTSNPCVAGPNIDPASIKMGPSFSRVSSTCTATTAPSAPTPTWGTTKHFCGVGQQSSTCPAAQICVPKPATVQPVCVRVPSAGAGCPAGYPNTQGTWYGAFNAATCSCGTCSVNTTGACPTSAIESHVFIWDMASCMGTVNGAIFATSNFSQCITPPATCPGFFCNGWGLIPSLRFEGPITPSVEGTCSRPTTTTTAASPTGPSTICCQ